MQKIPVGIESPWKYDSMSEDEFKRTANSGDILLFRGTRMATAITRGITASEFDHVAVVIRLNNNEDVHFLEATGGPGVSINSWSNLKQYVGQGQFYERIVFRHVNFKRKNKILNQFCRFAKEAIGHKYSISYSSLMKQKTQKMAFNKFIEDDRTFFCSELVAKSFKILGVLVDDDISCS